MLEREEKKYPDGYYTAANLGTAFELAGDNAKALRWIKEGMARKEDSHYGTEWLHVKILEAKIAMAKDKRWLEQNTVLGLDWQALGSDLSKVLVTGHDGKVYNATAVQKALEYQLHERTEFVKPPDPIVGQLLVDLSKLVEVSISPEHGVAVLRLAASYDTSIQPPPEPPTAALEVVTVSTPILSRSNLLYLAVPFAAFLFLTLLIVWRRKKGGIKPPFP